MNNKIPIILAKGVKISKSIFDESVIGEPIPKKLFLGGMLDFEVMSRVATMFVLLGLYYVYNYGNNLARLFVISYVALNSLTFGFYGWAIYPDIYMESDQWLNGK